MKKTASTAAALGSQRIVCADDFGMHPAVNQAVLELARLGVLNATTCLVDGSAFAQDTAALRASPLQTGLHLNFTENFALAEQHPDTQTRADAQRFAIMPLAKLIRHTWLRRLPGDALRREVARQLDRFETLMQRAPDFIDGHQHVHQFPQIRDALVAELWQRYPHHPTLWLRSTRYYASATLTSSTRPGVVPPPAMAHPHRSKALMIEQLGARALERKVAGRWRMNRALAGVYDFQGGQVVYTRLLTHWLTAMQPGDVLMCHPASQRMAHDPLGEQRLAEYRALAAMGAG